MTTQKAAYSIAILALAFGLFSEYQRGAFPQASQAFNHTVDRAESLMCGLITRVEGDFAVARAFTRSQRVESKDLVAAAEARELANQKAELLREQAQMKAEVFRSESQAKAEAMREELQARAELLRMQAQLKRAHFKDMCSSGHSWIHIEDGNGSIVSLGPDTCTGINKQIATALASLPKVVPLHISAHDNDNNDDDEDTF